MAKTVKPYKTLIALYADGTVSQILYQYKIEVDGVTVNKFFTMDIAGAVDMSALNTELNKALVAVQAAET